MRCWRGDVAADESGFVALVIGVGHVDYFTDGGDVGFSIAEQAQPVRPQIR
jgi:hypothetical protein